jgi:hypothetical protein
MKQGIPCTDLKIYVLSTLLPSENTRLYSNTFKAKEEEEKYIK